MLTDSFDRFAPIDMQTWFLKFSLNFQSANAFRICSMFSEICLMLNFMNKTISYSFLFILIGRKVICVGKWLSLLLASYE